jgi:two-component system, LytTR family, sensor kinase
MKSISSYIYNKRAILGEWLFWLFWYFYACFYVGSSTNMLKSGAMVWAVGSTLASYSIYRLALVCVNRMFADSKYIIYLILLFFVGYGFRTLVGELSWQIALRYFDFGTFTKDYNHMINIEGGGLLKRLQFLLFNTDFFLSQPSRWFPISLKLMIDLVMDQRKNNALEKNKMDLEIKLLKSQINPQFINGALENIKKLTATAPEQAAQMVLKLSNTTRYTLYETDVDAVALPKELDFIINCIDLEESRLPSQVNINFRLKTEQSEYLQIAPMLLFPLINSAFKCLKSECDIDLLVEKSVLTLRVEADKINSCQNDAIENTQKRLAYLYPNKHRLQLIENEYVYKMELRLELEKAMTEKKSMN